jgi:hypothetical protein
MGLNPMPGHDLAQERFIGLNLLAVKKWQVETHRFIRLPFIS